MTRSCRRDRGFILLELIFMLTISAIVVFLLYKMCIDGMYIQRLASERDNRVTTLNAMIERLRADALVMSGYSWDQTGESAILDLITCTVEQTTHVTWIFGPIEIRRLEDGRDAGVFSADRLTFKTMLERGEHADTLVLQTIVAPPERNRQRDPQIDRSGVLLFHRPNTPVVFEEVYSL